MLKGVKILVAEDNGLNQKIVNFILQKQNAEVTTVSDGNKAIEQLKQQHFDIILMDLQMPELDGYETTEYIRKEMGNNIPIIALSASKMDADIKKCLDAGMNACISKPFDPLALCEAILQILKENKISA